MHMNLVIGPDIYSYCEFNLGRSLHAGIQLNLMYYYATSCHNGIVDNAINVMALFIFCWDCYEAMAAVAIYKFWIGVLIMT